MKADTPQVSPDVDDASKGRKKEHCAVHKLPTPIQTCNTHPSHPPFFLHPRPLNPPSTLPPSPHLITHPPSLPTSPEMGCLLSKPFPPRTPSPTPHFQSSHYGADEERAAHKAAMAQYPIGLASRKGAQDQKFGFCRRGRRSSGVSRSRVDRMKVMNGVVWLY